KASAESDLIKAEADVRTKNIALIRLLNPETPAQWSVRFDLKDLPNVADVPVSADISAQLSKAYKPELAQARLQLTNKDLQVVLTKNGLLPKLDASVTYGRLGYAASAGKSVSHLDQDKYNNYEAGLSFEMAPLNRAERAAHRSAVFSQQQAEASVANEEQLLETDARKAVETVIEQRETVPAKQKAVKNYEEALKAEQTKFSLGKSTNYDVLTANNNLVSSKLEEVTARVNYIEAVTALYYAEGTLLERRGVGAKGK
ncbi:TPA: TolC family protein, partial [Candidatus Sumerlaeota bacterium]|nr:TolC family protein [Candidatus Sumerlaeota bacterium]